MLSCTVFTRHVLPVLSPSMPMLHGPVLQEFANGNHVVRHQRSIWNRLCSDIYIESTFIRYEHNPKGIVGMTFRPAAMNQ